MNRNAKVLVKQVGDYAHLLDRVSDEGRFEGVSSEGPIQLLTDQELLAGTESLAQVRRLVDAELTKRAGEIARGSEPRDETSLARRMGAGTAANLVAQVTGGTRTQAGTMVASGEAFRPQVNGFTGEAMPARYPQVAAAFTDGLLDAEVAAAMRRALAKSAPGLTPSEIVELERQLVEYSQEGWNADEVLAWLKQVPDHAHPDGGAPRDDEPAPSQSVPRKLLRNGLFRWVLDLDALTDGFLKTAIDANTAIKRSTLTTPDDLDPDAETADGLPTTADRSPSGASTASACWPRRR